MDQFDDDQGDSVVDITKEAEAEVANAAEDPAFRSLDTDAGGRRCLRARPAAPSWCTCLDHIVAVSAPVYSVSLRVTSHSLVLARDLFDVRVGPTVNLHGFADLRDDDADNADDEERPPPPSEAPPALRDEDPPGRRQSIQSWVEPDDNGGLDDLDDDELDGVRCPQLALPVNRAPCVNPGICVGSLCWQYLLRWPIRPAYQSC